MFFITICSEILSTTICSDIFIDLYIVEAMASALGDNLNTALLDGAKSGLNSLNVYVQSGSEGVSFICFVVGLFTTAVGGLEVLLTVLNPLSIIYSPASLVPFYFLLINSFQSII